jgi:DNA-binding CsgD family transcriptional regulator
MTARRERGLTQSSFELAEPQLTAREQAVLLRLAQHQSVREIATASFISVNTVKTHIKSIYLKLGVNNREEAVRRTYELGLLPPLSDGHEPHPPSPRADGHQSRIDLTGVEAVRASFAAMLDGVGEERLSLESLAALNPDALEVSGLDEETYYLIRLAALVALDAPASTYRLLLAGAGSAITSEQAEAALLAVADLVGSTRAAAAASYLLDALNRRG